MRVFVDECVNRLLLRRLSGHTFTHALDTTLRSTKNGELLRAISSDYDAFLTCDSNIRFQQNLKRFTLAFAVLRARSNRIEDLTPLIPRLLTALGRLDKEGFGPGELIEIS